LKLCLCEGVTVLTVRGFSAAKHGIMKSRVAQYGKILYCTFYEQISYYVFICDFISHYITEEALWDVKPYYTYTAAVR